MISYLKGKIKYLGVNWLILEVGGVGYKVQLKNQKFQPKAGPPLAEKLKIGDTSEFYIYNHIREDRNELYGFNSIEELVFFELLLQVNGVGPKMAMNIMGKASVEKLQEAISSGDATLLTAISGIGKKMSMKILVELKNKIDLGNLSLSDLDSIESDELVSAMESLGYKKAELAAYLAKMPVELKTTQAKVKWLLKSMKN